MSFLPPIGRCASRRLPTQGSVPAALGGEDMFADPVALRQLRHQTKNALQRIIGQVSHDKTLRRTREGRRLIEDVQRRIVLAARISDALFGLTQAPGPLHVRLRALGESVVDLLGDPDQVIHLDTTVTGDCPAVLDGVVLRVAHEFLGNAVKHGMHARVVGRIQIRLCSEAGWTRLDMVDDGWGCGTAPVHGEGMAVAAALAARHGGVVGLCRQGETTVATLDLPHPPAG